MLTMIQIWNAPNELHRRIRARAGTRLPVIVAMFRRYSTYPRDGGKRQDLPLCSFLAWQRSDGA